MHFFLIVKVHIRSIAQLLSIIRIGFMMSEVIAADARLPEARYFDKPKKKKTKEKNNKKTPTF